MDWSSFLGGVLAALTGVFATVFVTEWIETKKQLFESKKALACLYTELGDLQEECSESLQVLQDTYYRGWHIEKNMQANIMCDGLSIPKPPNTIVLLSHIEKSMGDLTKTQRKGIRTILHLCKETETSMYSLSHQIHNDNISTTKVKYCMSVLCALYHVSLNMKEQEQRYTEINKLPLEVHDSVLDALGIDLSFKACASYKPAT